MVTNDHLWWQFQEASLKIRKSCNKTFDDMGDIVKSTNFKWLVPFEFTIRPFEIALVALPILNGMTR